MVRGEKSHTKERAINQSFLKKVWQGHPYICKNNTRTEKVANKSSLDGGDTNVFRAIEQIISLCKAVGLRASARSAYRDHIICENRHVAFSLCPDAHNSITVMSVLNEKL